MRLPAVLARPLSDTRATTRSSGTDAVFDKFNDVQAEAAKEINKRIEKVAKDVNASMAQVAYAWVLAQDYVTAPIVGATKIDHLVEAIGELSLTSVSG